MFVGIVQGTAKVEELAAQPDFCRIGVRLPVSACTNLQQGASIALNGVCLTITSWQDNLVFFDVMQATLRLTNLGALQLGEVVNFERAARLQDEIGGHLMSGHIIDQVQLIKREELDTNNLRLQFSVAEQWHKYLFDKGFVGLNGCSLTVAELTPAGFSVYLIPETRRATTFDSLPEGAWVNLEIDPQTQAIVATVERVLASRGL